MEQPLQPPLQPRRLVATALFSCPTGASSWLELACVGRPVAPTPPGNGPCARSPRRGSRGARRACSRPSRFLSALQLATGTEHWRVTERVRLLRCWRPARHRAPPVGSGGRGEGARMPKGVMTWAGGHGRLPLPRAAQSSRRAGLAAALHLCGTGGSPWRFVTTQLSPPPSADPAFTCLLPSESPARTYR